MPILFQSRDGRFVLDVDDRWCRLLDRGRPADPPLGSWPVSAGPGPALAYAQYLGAPMVPGDGSGHPPSAPAAPERTPSAGWSATAPWFAAVAGAALLVDLTANVVVLATGRTVGWLAGLTGPAVLVLVAGQLFMILGLRATRAKDGRPTPSWSSAVQVAAGAAAAAGLVSGLVAFGGLSAGGPSPSTPTCRYPLNDHGAQTCVSHARYLAVGADQVRFALGVVGLFLAVHLISATVIAGRRPVPSPTSAADDPPSLGAAAAQSP